MEFNGKFKIVSKGRLLETSKISYLEMTPYASPQGLVIYADEPMEHQIFKSVLNAINSNSAKKKDYLIDGVIYDENDSPVITFYNAFPESASTDSVHICAEFEEFNPDNEISSKISEICTNNDEIIRKTMPKYSDCLEDWDD